MKYAIATLLVLTSAVTTVALAQDGNGRGPPIKKASVVFVAQSTTSAQTKTLAKLFQPKSVLESLAK
jgi:hypothetical protein